MSDSTTLGDRMKAYEAAHRAVLPRRTYTIIRLDVLSHEVGSTCLNFLTC